MEELEQYVIENKVKEKREVPNGDYEVVIFGLNPQETPSGYKKIDVDLQIRKDIPSNPIAYHNWHLHDTIWYNEELGKYNPDKISELVNAIRKNNTETITITGIENVMKMLKGAYCKVKYKKSVDKNLKAKQYFDYEPTNYVVEDKEAEEHTTEETHEEIVDDKDLWF